ncbi:MAG TPA: SpoIIE family protein phosphatase [Vicinamibacteria bacterium]|nr:SpoIIE family protein phosphatase [Vicinamibacteria bacterium]
MPGLPIVLQYQKALDDFRREPSDAGALLKRMSELISLLDLTVTLSSSASTAEVLEAALLVVMGELQAARGCVFVRGEGGRYLLQAHRGLPADAPPEVPLGALGSDEVVFHHSGRHVDVFDAFGLDVLCPIFKAERAVAVIGLGRRAGGRPFGPEETAFLRSVAACASTPIENGLIYDELRTVNQRLSVKVFQLHNLFDISRELTASFDEETIKNLVTTTLMGHLLVSRCALYLDGPGGLALAHERGARAEEGSRVVPEPEAAALRAALRRSLEVSDLPEGPLRDRLARHRMALVVPLAMGSTVRGFLAVGERVSGAPFSEEDRDFAQTLARQALTALESVRLHRVQLEKQRQDKELQIAREIQQGLFPPRTPAIAGFEIAARSLACYQVGGDYYDFIPLPAGRWALIIADVSGKGTPASILMASVHASLRALAGTAPPAVVMERVNAFLYESTQANKYVTLVYAELDPATRRLTYVNAGHVPPYLLRRDGSTRRLTAGGPVLGLLEDVRYEVAEVELLPGDVVAMVTDGATEALSADEHEMGDERLVQALVTAGASAAEAQIQRLIETVDAWTAERGCTDDLTALVLRAV